MPLAFGRTKCERRVLLHDDPFRWSRSLIEASPVQQTETTARFYIANAVLWNISLRGSDDHTQRWKDSKLLL